MIPLITLNVCLLVRLEYQNFIEAKFGHQINLRLISNMVTINIKDLRRSLSN